MTATAMPATNGKPPRKQLSDQLDRLDNMVDLLADRLPEAVAEATREGARQAVKDVLIELLTNPELRTMIAGLNAPVVAPPPVAPADPTPTEPAKPGLWSRLKEKAASAGEAVSGRCRAAKETVVRTARSLSSVMPLRKILLVGVGVGLAVGLVSLAAPHAVAAVVGGVGAACTAVGVQVGNWFRRSAALLGFARTG